MRLFDTSVWIEWLAGTPTGQKFNDEFLSLESLIVPTLVQFELYKWHVRERTMEEAERVLAFSTSGIVTPLDTATAVHAATLSLAHRLHATDAIIYATAMALNATLVTCDSHFDGLPSVSYFAKPVP